MTVALSLTDSFFLEVNSHLENLKSADEEINERGYSFELQKKISDDFDHLEEVCISFESSVGCPEIIEEAKEHFRELKEPYYSKSFLMDSALKKPRGYPGDFETLEGIYDNVVRSVGVGALLDRCFLDSRLAVAVRNRKDMVKDFFYQELLRRRGEKFSVLNIASGSCREWVELSQMQDLNLPYLTFKGDLELYCLDNDPDSLEYSKEKLLYNNIANVKFINDNALKFAVKPESVIKDKKFDCVYSIGLSDYLPDKSLTRLIEAQLEVLNDDGRVLIAFKDRAQYYPARYDWVTDWRFIPRKEHDICSLFSKVGIDCRKIGNRRDTTGAMLIYDIRKE